MKGDQLYLRQIPDALEKIESYSCRLGRPTAGHRERLLERMEVLAAETDTVSDDR
jgi:hypothetical protein